MTDHVHHWAVNGERIGVVCKNPDDPRVCGAWLTQEEIIERLEENAAMRDECQVLRQRLEAAVEVIRFAEGELGIMHKVGQAAWQYLAGEVTP